MLPITLVQSLGRRRVRIGITLAAFGFLVLLGYGAVNLAQAQDSEGPAVIKGALETQAMTPSVFNGDVRDIPKVKAWKSGDPIRDIPRRGFPRQLSSDLEATPPSRLDPLLELGLCSEISQFT